MPSKKIICKAMIANFVIGVVICAILGYVMHLTTSAFLLGSAIGVVCSFVAVYLFFATWKAAPNRSRAITLYVLRVVLIFGSVVLAMFLPFVDALGVVLPQLPTALVLVVLLALEKTDKEMH